MKASLKQIARYRERIQRRMVKNITMVPKQYRFWKYAARHAEKKVTHHYFALGIKNGFPHSLLCALKVVEYCF